MSARQYRPLRVAAVAAAAAVLLAACSSPRATTSPPGFTGFPDGPDTPFSPVKLEGVAGCARLTLAARPSGGSTGVSLPCLTGPRTVDVDHLGSRLTVVNLWASWCSVCRKEMPVLEAAYRESDESVQFVGVDTLDETGPAATFLRQTGASYPQLYDQQGALLKYTRVPGLPVTLLLDAKGKEIGRHVGELSDTDLRDLISTG